MKFKKRKKQLRKITFAEVSKLNPKYDDIIILHYPYGEIPYDQLVNEYKYISKIFKDNKLIAIPNTASLEMCSEYELNKIVEHLQETIKLK
jgi:arabinogalactan endo-1,4-beta-galactosidase